MGKEHDPELDSHLSGDSEVSRQYRQLRPPPLPGEEVDARLMRAARQKLSGDLRAINDLAPRRRPPWFAPFALAASVVLSVALVLAVILEPMKQRRNDDGAHWIYAAAHRSDRLPLRVEIPMAAPQRRDSQAQTRDAQSWLMRIRELRREGRNIEADAEYQRFRAAFPNSAISAADAEAPPEH